MREIKYRGREIHNGAWVYGYLIGSDVIVGKIVEWEDDYFCTEWWLKVDPDTVGQYTGLKDVEENEIYDGHLCTDDGVSVLQVLWSDSHHQWGVKVITGSGTLSIGLTFPLWHWDNCKQNGYRQLKIIGDIYRNPELIEV